MWLCNVIYFCVSNCVCCAQGVAEEQLRLMLPPCLNNKKITIACYKFNSKNTITHPCQKVFGHDYVTNTQ